MTKDMQKFNDVKEEDERVYAMVLQSGIQAMCVNRPDKLSSLVEAVGDAAAAAGDDDEQKKQQGNDKDKLS